MKLSLWSFVVTTTTMVTTLPLVVVNGQTSGAGVVGGSMPLMPEVSLDECLNTLKGELVDVVAGEGDPNNPLLCDDYTMAFGRLAATETTSSAQLRAGDGDYVLCCPTEDSPLPDGLPHALEERLELTREECITGYSGEIVGDIGDGAIFEPTYICPDPINLPPIGNIIQEGETNIAVEGEVCCTLEVPMVAEIASNAGNGNIPLMTEDDTDSAAMTSTTATTMSMAVLILVASMMMILN